MKKNKQATAFNTQDRSVLIGSNKANRGEFRRFQPETLVNMPIVDLLKLYAEKKAVIRAAYEKGVTLRLHGAELQLCQLAQ